MKFRQPLKITGRISSITNAFVQAIIPRIEPSQEDIILALKHLGMTPEAMSCVYCGSPTTDWDHLKPLVRGKRSTGYFHEIRNLVPSCGRCNQSKSGADWRAWMASKAPGSPKTRGIVDLAERMERLRRFEEWGALKPLSPSELVDQALLDQHWAHLESITEAMKVAQLHAEHLRNEIRNKLASKAPAAD